MKEFKTKEFIEIFKRNGWELKKDGSHIKMAKVGINYTVSIPNHGKTISMPLGRRLLKECGIEV